MAGWDEGYVSDVGYTMGYYGDMNPLRVRMALLHAGWHAPEVAAACELGFGQGLSINLHAAGAPVQWWGTDFNPVQASFAQGLAQAAKADAQLFDDAFAEFAARNDVPPLDFIALHGIWSWVSEKNRALIVDFLRRKLKVGGVAYISYNTLPGWGGFAPMRELLALHDQAMGAPADGSVRRARAALDFAQRLLATQPLYARANPVVEHRVKDLLGKDSHYIVHEYLNRDWHPMLFSAIASELEGAKLQFACSARLLDHVPALHLTDEQQALLADINDTVFRETVQDYLINQQFRADLWIKGGRRLTGQERTRRLGELRLLLLQAPDTVLNGKVRGTRGEAVLKPDVYGPVLKALADHQPHTLHDVLKQASGGALDSTAILQAVVVLTGAGQLAPAAAEAAIECATPSARRLNQELLSRCADGTGVDYLVSPVLGGGLQVSAFHQLILTAMQQPGAHQPTDWARWVWQHMERRGQRAIKDGKPLETAELALTVITEQAQQFARETLPRLRILGVA